MLKSLESILCDVEFFFLAVGQVLLELDLLVADSDEVSDFEDEGEDEGKEPENGTDFSVFLGVELQEIDLAQDLQVVKEPVSQKAQSVQDVEVESEFVFFNLIQKLSYFLIFINTLEQSKQLSSISHSDFSHINIVLSQTKDFLPNNPLNLLESSGLLAKVDQVMNLEAYWMALQNLSRPSKTLEMGGKEKGGTGLVDPGDSSV